MTSLAGSVVVPSGIRSPEETIQPGTSVSFRNFRFDHTSFRKLNTGTPNAQVSPSLVAIIVILTVIFFLSAFLHLLIRWLARSPRRNPNAGVALTELQDQLQQLFQIHDSGIEQEFIDALPVFVFKIVMGLKEGADCAVCLCEFESDDRLRLLPSCSHAFHMQCIDAWLVSHSTCPLCRRALQPEYSTLCPSGEGVLLDSSRSSVVGYADRIGDLQREVPGEISGHHGLAPRSQVDERICSISLHPSHRQQDNLAHQGNNFVPEARIDAEDMGCSSRHGNGRKVSIQLGRCKIIHEKSCSSAGISASRRFHSKGSYEYVVDPSNLEVMVESTPQGPRTPTFRRFDLPGHATTLSAEAVETNGSPLKEARSYRSSSASFSRLRSVQDEVAATDRDRHFYPFPRLVFYANSSTLSIRTEAGKEITTESLDKDRNITEGKVLNSNEIFLPGERSKRAVSFRLPTSTNSRLQADSRRRALSETELAAADLRSKRLEAFSLGKAPSENYQGAQPPRDEDVHFVTSSASCSVLPSSNLANRTMDWLTEGWQKRLVHPDSGIPPV